MKKRVWLVLLVVLLAAGLAGWTLWHYLDTHLFVEDAVYDRDASFLDLHGQEISISHYETLRQELPQCDIAWDVPFQGNAVPDDTEAVTVTTLTPEDVETLDYLPELKRLDALECRDYEALWALQQRRPELEINYQVVINGEIYPKDTKELDVSQGDPEEMMEKLRYLPQLSAVRFSEMQMPAQSLLALTEAYPKVAFTWEKTVLGQTFPSTVTELDFSGTPLTGVEELEEAMAYFPHLEKLILCDTGLDDETMAAYRERVRDQYKVVWNVSMGKVTVRTDATTLMPYLFGYTGEPHNELKADQCGPMKYLEDMVCLDLGHMEVEDISFVRYMPNLEYLLVADTGISDISPVAGLEKLKYLEIFYNHITDVSALTQCPALEDVNMCYNKVSDITPLLGMKQLNNLWMSGLYLTQDQMNQLKETLPETTIQFFVEGSVGKGWRRLPNYYAQRDMLGIWYLS